MPTVPSSTFHMLSYARLRPGVPALNPTPFSDVSNEHGPEYVGQASLTNKLGMRALQSFSSPAMESLLASGRITQPISS